MLNIAFTVTPTISTATLAIEQLRRDILTAPINPKIKLRFRWDTMVSRIFALADQRSFDISKKDLTRLLAHPPTIRRSQKIDTLLSYRSMLSRLQTEWIASSKTASLGTIESMGQALFGIGWRERAAGLRQHETMIRQLLAWTQSLESHPAITASIAFLQWQLLSPLGNESILLGYPLAYLFFFKRGYDIGGLLNLEEAWRWEDPQTQRIAMEVKASGSATPWIEYAGQRLVEALETIKTKTANTTPDTSLPAAFWELNDRQKTILELLEAPGATVTNRQVQKRFKISQITASRDLAKLASLNLLVSRGAGRSVSYTRL